MRDWQVTKKGAGTANFLPRIVRCEDPRDAVKATMVDICVEPTKIRKWPNVEDYVVYSELKYPSQWVSEESATYQVRPYRPSEWECDFWVNNPQRLVRIRKNGEHVKSWSTGPDA